MSGLPREFDSGILSVSELTAGIRQALEREFPALWVRGEVSNLRRQASGHLYFTLKDAGSQLPAVLFRGDAARQDLTLKDGMELLCHGRISVYEPRGAYQMIVRIVLDEGLGRLREAFERLKERLGREGLFDPDRKRAIPRLPRTVGMITSPSGAAVRDFVGILRRRGWRGRLLIFPAVVQGESAGPSLVSMLEAAARVPDLDLLVIGRGGGSLEDLWAFNEEPVVRAVAAFPRPVISAVGHEIDFVLTDFAADRRAETPSAAAEMVAVTFEDWVRELADGRRRLLRGMQIHLDDFGQRLDYAAARLRAAAPGHRVHRDCRRIRILAEKLQVGLEMRIRRQQRLLDGLERRLQGTDPAHSLRFARQRLQHLETRLKSASVESTLRRGYTLVRDESGQLVKQAGNLQTGTRIEQLFADGSAWSRVEQVHLSNQKEKGA